MVNDQVVDLMLSDHRVNKGTGLKIALHLMHKARAFEGKPVLMSVLGDDLPDIPMLRPEQQTNTLARMNEKELSLRKTSVKHLLNNHYSQPLPVQWLMSVVFHSKRLLNMSNEYVRSMLNHPRILTINPTESGVLQGLEAVTEKLKSTSPDHWLSSPLINSF